MGMEESFSTASISEGDDFTNKINDPTFGRKYRDFTVMLKNKPVDKRPSYQAIYEKNPT
jgi:hypothetical protein